MVDDDEMPPVEAEFRGTALFAGKDNPARYDLDEFRRLHKPLTLRHERLLRSHYGFSDRLLRLLLDAIRIVEEQPEADRASKRSFLFAFLMLGSKIISHAESIRVLVDVGRYGDATGLLRFAFSDCVMLRYLALFPEDVPDWFDLSQLRPPTGRPSERYKRLAKKFWEGAVRKKLLEKGVHVPAGTFSDLSEAVHPTSWGMGYYGDVDPGRVLHIHYAPFYDPLPKAQALAVSLIDVLKEPMDVLIDWCNRQALQWHKGVEARWMVLRIQAGKFTQIAASVVEAGMEELYPDD